MVKEITIDAETARRLLFILSLEGDVKREEIEWALGIIHQIPGYGSITLGKAAQDRALKEVLVAIAAEQISPTTPKNLETLIEDAEKRRAALEAAEKTGERETEEFIKAAEKATKAKAQTQVSPPAPGVPLKEGAGIEIKITPGALAAFQESLGKTAGAPFKLITFFSPPRATPETPARATTFSSAMSLSQISAKAKGLPEAEGKRLMRLVENLRQAEFSFYAQVKLQRTSVSVQDMILLMGPEFGRPQGEVVAFVRGGAPPGRGPSFTSRVGLQVFGGLAQRAVSKAATKAVTSALTKTGVAVAGAEIGAAVGGPAAPITSLVGLAVGWVVDKVVGPLINKVVDFISKNKWVLATPFVLAGLVLGLPLLTVGGLALGGFLAAGGVGPALSLAGGVATSAISSIASITVASIATPFIAALISIPILVAILLFIINSGAYLVPPKSDLIPGLLVSPYIDVQKVALRPKDPDKCKDANVAPGKQAASLKCDNADLPLDIEYTVTIRAKKGSLTNVRLQYSCEVIKDKSKPPCPPPDPAIPSGTEIPSTISPTQAYSFKYTQPYSNPLFVDSLVIDTLTVTADASEQKDARAAGSASITIGNPPQDCPSGWPVSSGALTQGAYTSSSHKGAEAIDIGGVGVGTPTTARHTGIVRVTDSWPYGKNVEVDSLCNGKTFFSRYSHLSVISVRTGEKVTLGQVVGLTGNTGNSGGAHLHYEFRYPAGPTQYPDRPPYLMTPFVPKNLPRGCVEPENCNTSIP